MSNAHRMPAWTAILLLLLPFSTSSPDAAYTGPQVAALDALKAASATPPELRYRHGFPSSVRVDVPASGTTDVERARSFLTTYAAFYLQDHPEIELVHSRSDSDPDLGTAVRFAQRAYGFPVFGAGIVARVGRDSTGLPRIYGTTGTLFVPARTHRIPEVVVEFDREPAILPETAEDAARAEEGDPGAPAEGKTILMIHDPGMIDETSGPRLAWRVTLRSGDPVQYLVDANTGEILLRHSLAPQAPGLSDFDLDLEDANGGTMAGTNCFNPTTIDDNIGDEDGIDPAYFGDNDAVMAWWHARATYLMYHDTFGRHSYDNDDGELEVYVHAGSANAGGTGSCGVEFANGWVSLDVMGHEFTHMVDDFGSGLLYVGQSGAIEESMADIMGAVLDWTDWLIGEDRTSGFGAIRDLDSPEVLSCPDASICPNTMSQYVTTANDNGGVHTNSLIISKAFTLMADGGAQGGITVAGMGRPKMGHLAYRTFLGLGWSTQFIEFRDAVITAAILLDATNAHGFNAQDVCTARNGLAAVGIGQPDFDCDGVEDIFIDSDGDGILDDGDGIGGSGNYPCPDGVTLLCDDNCPNVENPAQVDLDGDGMGDACDSDSDQDGVPDVQDNCPGIPGTTPDSDSDGIFDCFDLDDDNDGILDDGDSSGTVGDFLCPSNVTVDCDDNCRLNPNASQFDGNGNGMGDACDPDVDGDGFYGGLSNEDNCPFTYNPSQADTDTDGLGDACDGCPNIKDNANAWHPGYPELGIDPYPIQNDSDGDGIPDACDNMGFASAGASIGGAFYHVGNAVRPSGAPEDLEVSGAPGSILRLPFLACENGEPEGPGIDERVEAEFQGLPPSLEGWVENGSGEVRARIGPHASDPALRGFRFRPRCHEEHFLVLRADTTFTGAAAFQVTVDAGPVPEDNPWSSTAGRFPDPPAPAPDQDGDGLPDGADTCPLVEDPTNADADHDGVGDVCDPDPGGVETLQITGTVASVDDGAGPPAFPGLSPGMPFTGTLVYDSTMRLKVDDYPVARTYVQPRPIAPLALSVRLAGFDFSAGPESDLELLVENDHPVDGDLFRISSGDVAEHSVATESLVLLLRDPSSTALTDVAVPPCPDVGNYSERQILIDLDNGSAETSTHLVLDIVTMSAPYQEPSVYWLDSATHEINRSDADGSGITTLVTADDPIGFEVDPAGDRIYWTECCLGKVRSSALDGSGIVDLATGLGNPYGIGLDGPRGTLAFADLGIPAQIYSLAAGGGSPTQLVDTSPNTPYGLAVDGTAGKMYWTEFGTTSMIRRANLDGSAAETLIDGSVDPMAESRGIALDPAAGKMYWTDLTLRRIYRANLDGTGQELLADVRSAGLEAPEGIAVDAVHGKLYWTDTTTDRIQRSNLDGSMVETVLRGSDGLSLPRDVFVDPGTDCQPPTDALGIDRIELTNGTDVKLTLSDPNAAIQVTGYNVYRSTDASLPEASWPLVALDAPDGEPFTPGVQWTDASGGPAPGEFWFYVAAAYNASCPLEGPLAAELK